MLCHPPLPPPGLLLQRPQHPWIYVCRSTASCPSRTSVIMPSVDSPQRPAFSVVSPIKQLGPMRVPFHSALVGTPVRAPGQENQSFPAPATMGTSPSFSGSPIDIDQFFNDIIAEEVLGVPSSTNDVFGLFGPANHLLSPNAQGWMTDRGRWGHIIHQYRHCRRP